MYTPRGAWPSEAVCLTPERHVKMFCLEFPVVWSFSLSHNLSVSHIVMLYILKNEVNENKWFLVLPFIFIHFICEKLVLYV